MKQTDSLSQLSSEERSALAQALEKCGTIQKILQTLCVSIPKNEGDRIQCLADFLKVYGSKRFLELVFEDEILRQSAVTKKPDLKPPSPQPTKLQSKLPKIRLSEEETQTVRKRSPINQHSNQTAHRKTRESSKEDYSEKESPAEAEAPVQKIQADQKSETESPKVSDWDGVTERRSGEERRKESRRRNVDLVFKNSRFGRDRRTGKDRRTK